MIDIAAALMKNIGPAGGKIEVMKKAAVGMAHFARRGPADHQMISTRSRTEMIAKTKLALFVMDQPIR